MQCRACILGVCPTTTFTVWLVERATCSCRSQPQRTQTGLEVTARMHKRQKALLTATVAVTQSSKCVYNNATQAHCCCMKTTTLHNAGVQAHICWMGHGCIDRPAGRPQSQGGMRSPHPPQNVRVQRRPDTQDTRRSHEALHSSPPPRIPDVNSLNCVARAA